MEASISRRPPSQELNSSSHGLKQKLLLRKVPEQYRYSRLLQYHLLMRPIIYIASPLGFTEPGRLWQDQVLLPRLADLDCITYDPWDLPRDAQAILDQALALTPSQERSALFYKFNRLHGAHNVQALDGSSGMLAILDGVDLDSGTAAEVGYMSAQGKPVIGLRTDFRLASDNEADPINLQVVYFVEASGGRLVHSLDEAVALIDNLVVQP